MSVSRILGHLSGIPFVEAAIRYVGITTNIHGLDELPAGRYTFAGNHPLGGIDGMSTGFAVHQKFPDQSIKFLSNDLLSNLDNLSPLFVPVNKIGNQSQHRSLPLAFERSLSIGCSNGHFSGRHLL